MDELRRLRESVNVTYAELDRRIGRPNRNYVARVERGELPIPDRDTVVKLGDELLREGAETSGSALWAIAAPEAAMAIDPAIREFYESQLHAAQASTADLSESERRLVGAIRWADGRDLIRRSDLTKAVSEDGASADEMQRLKTLEPLDTADALVGVLDGFDAAAEHRRQDPAVYVRSVLSQFSALPREVRGRLLAMLDEGLALHQLGHLRGRGDELEQLSRSFDGLVDANKERQ